MKEKMLHHRSVSWLKKSRINIFQFIIYLAIFIFAGYKIVNYYSDKLYIKNDFLITKGKIVKCDEFGVGPNKYLTYSYIVEGKEFKREINGPNVTFDDCKEQNSKCEHKRFFVIYSPKHPERSLIDLTLEIQEVEDPKFPSTLLKLQ
jgi:hypothetical protein